MKWWSLRQCRAYANKNGLSDFWARCQYVWEHTMQTELEMHGQFELAYLRAVKAYKASKETNHDPDQDQPR